MQLWISFERRSVKPRFTFKGTSWILLLSLLSIFPSRPITPLPCCSTTGGQDVVWSTHPFPAGQDSWRGEKVRAPFCVWVRCKKVWHIAGDLWMRIVLFCQSSFLKRQTSHILGIHQILKHANFTFYKDTSCKYVKCVIVFPFKISRWHSIYNYLEDVVLFIMFSVT